MTFINEKVIEQDIEKYGFREINKQFVRGDVSYYWTIDRDRNIYLRDMGGNWQEPTEMRMSFYWKGHLLRQDLRLIESTSTRDGEGSQTLGLSTISERKTIWLPPELEGNRQQITDDFKEALLAYKGSGVFSTLTSYTAKFLF